ncbi:Xaa-Pro peptidase family protein [Bradyrhizobium sp. CCBAU 53421]|uniref:M24 family metallopeptidase n=1 Tax=Bradyrhizobium sp. CCBAU 53421 TaxID=1325120 RepID=UPI00188A16B7|nr:Xaa-Pro peptidase family protein [Bradyrhizobium sp. CCBAU 53421]QOZ36409.1 aminopeptidase P family protein [Bradyrhizobium sp. CCBAU 53421]
MAMPKGPQAFPRTEYLRRLSAVKSEMQQRGIDVLIVTTPQNIGYLTGYTAKSAYVPQGLIVSLKDEEPTFILRRMDAPAAIYQTFLAHNQIIGYPEGLIGNLERDGFDTIVDFLLDSGVAKRRIGLEEKFLTPQTIAKFKSRLPEASIDDFSNGVSWIRLVKSDLEIAVMREAAAITDAGMRRAQEVVRPGVREADAAAEIISTLARGANGKVGTDVHHSFFLCASPRTGTCHIKWTEETFRESSQVNLEFTGVRHGYVSPLMRTLSIGKPSDRLRRIHEGEVAALEAALLTVKPGATCADVATAFKNTLRKHGFEKESRCGYAIGLDWLEPTASLKEDDRTILQPNMTFHLMLGNWIDEDFGYSLSETIRVTKGGVETFSKLPRELFEIHP